MSIVREIPIGPAAAIFDINILGKTYRMRTLYRDADEGGWILDIDNADQTPIARGIPLVTGADLLEQYAYLGFTFQLGVVADDKIESVPSYTSLGIRHHLLIGIFDG